MVDEFGCEVRIHGLEFTSREERLDELLRDLLVLLGHDGQLPLRTSSIVSCRVRAAALRRARELRGAASALGGTGAGRGCRGGRGTAAGSSRRGRAG